jgi:hypothetical protein
MVDLVNLIITIVKKEVLIIERVNRITVNITYLLRMYYVYKIILFFRKHYTNYSVVQYSLCNRQRREPDNSAPSCAEVKNEWIYHSTQSRS